MFIGFKGFRVRWALFFVFVISLWFCSCPYQFNPLPSALIHSWVSHIEKVSCLMYRMLSWKEGDFSSGLTGFRV